MLIASKFKIIFSTHQLQDGDYNQEIPAQRVAHLNSRKFSATTTSRSLSSSSSSNSSNGLCDPCNRNQELKMQQLASFEPDDDRNYDAEVDEFRRQLEQAYRLCPRCERQLRRTLNRVKNTVLGSKLAQIGAHGLRAFDLHMSASNRLAIAHRKMRIACFASATLLVLSVVQLIQTARGVRLSRTALNLVFPTSVTSALLLTHAVGKLCTLYAWTSVEYVLSTVWPVQWISTYWEQLRASLDMDGMEKLAREQPPVLVWDAVNTEQWAMIAAILLCVLVVWLKNCRLSSLFMLLAWSLKCSLPSAVTAIRSVSNPESAAYLSVVLDVVHLVIDTFVLVSSAQDAIAPFDRNQLHNQSANSSFHRIYTDADNLSDHSENETIFSSSTSVPDNNRTPLLNTSINTTRSISPSVFTPSTLRATQSIINGQNCSFSDDTLRPHYQQDNIYRASSVNNFYDVPEDFQSGITQLNINDKYVAGLRPQTSFDSFVAPTQSSPFVPFDTSQSQPLRYRRSHTSIIGPSRLQHSAEHTTSWIAGGYWNNGLSPTKRTAAATTPIIAPSPPFVTRNSSQSSGFESRESSISPAINPCDSASQCGAAEFTSADPPVVRRQSAASSINGFHGHQRSGLADSNSLGLWHSNIFDESIALRPLPQRFRAGTEMRFAQAPPMGSLLKAWSQRSSQLDIRHHT